MLILFASGKDIKSLLAEHIAKKISRVALLNVQILSFNLEKPDSIPELIFDVLKEKDYQVDNLVVRTIQEVPYDEADILITLSPSARDSCQYVKNHKRREHWNIDELTSMDLATLRRIRDQIESKMEDLFRITK